MEEKDPYATLGVSRGASRDEIRSAYRKLARKHHPDVNPNDPRAAEQFKDISFAHDILSDDAKRKLYDEFGVRGLDAGFDPEQARAYRRWQDGARRSPSYEGFSSEIDLEDLLGGFGFGQRRAPHGPRRGSDAQAEAAVDFVDAVRGGKITIHFKGKDPLNVTLPPGATDGTRIRLAGQGSPGPAGGPAGDLYITLRVRPHAFFERRGDDIHVAVPVTVPELVRGASIEVPTPDGPASMKVPAHSNNGRKLRLRGKGATRRTGGDRGDLYVTLKAVLPADDGRGDLERIASELEPLYGDQNVRAGLAGGE